MSWLPFLGTKKLSAGKIAKATKLACNPFAQPDVRMRELQRLADDGTPEAVRGLLKRFAASANGHIADEDEKKWLEDTLVDLGPEVVEPLREYIRSNDKLTYALRTHDRIVGEQASVSFFLEVLDRYGPEDHRSSESKLQLVLHLADRLREEGVLAALLPYLEDHSDDVRWAVIDVLDRATTDGLVDKDLQARACRCFVSQVCGEEAGPRIQQRAAEFLSKVEWPLPEQATELAAVLQEAFFLDKKRFVRRRASKQRAGAS